MTRSEDNINPCGQSLAVNIVRFSHFLKENTIPVPFSSVLDVLRGVDLIDISHMRAFHHLLRCNLVRRKEDLERFDQLFSEFWLFHEKAASKSFTSQGRKEGNNTEGTESSPVTSEVNFDTSEGSSNDVQEYALRYSTDPLLHRKDSKELDFEESQELYESICQLLRPLSNRLGRRFRYTVHGKDISLRRILRKNMQFGGELILLDFKKKKPKKHNIIFFCDVSGSMDVYTLLILQFVHALKRAEVRTEIFFFSTELTRATPLFDFGDFSTTLSRLPNRVIDWGGGTRTGHCLRTFKEIYGGKLLSSNTIVMIFSDGWDRGEIDLLEQQMSYLKSRAHRIVWLNPLLGTKDYQPICLGMSAALPYTDYFLPVSGLQDLHLIERTLERMITQ